MKVLKYPRIHRFYKIKNTSFRLRLRQRRRPTRLPEVDRLGGEEKTWGARQSGAIVVSKYMVDMGEKERQNGSCHVERDRSEEVKPMRSQLRRVAGLPSEVISGSGFLPRSTSGSVALRRPRSVLMSVASATTEG